MVLKELQFYISEHYKLCNTYKKKIRDFALGNQHRNLIEFNSEYLDKHSAYHMKTYCDRNMILLLYHKTITYSECNK